MAKRTRRRLVVVLSDLHCGHRLGLLAPGTELLEIGPRGEKQIRIPELGPTQEYLWDLYQGQIDAVMTQGRPVLIVNGDLTHGVKYRDGLFTEDVNEQCIVAERVLMPWIEAGVRQIRIVYGTGSHTMAGATERIIARSLSGARRGLGSHIVGHGLFAVGSKTFDVAHHGPSQGIREWTRGNQARYYLRSLMFSEIGQGRRPADWVIRSHYHTYLPPERVRAAGHSSEIVLTPSYCGMSGHSRQATRSAHVQTHGLLLFTVRGDSCHLEPMIETVDLRSTEAL